MHENIEEDEGRILKRSWIRIAILAVLSCLIVKYSDKVFVVLKMFIHILQPLILGFMIAYVLDILMKRLEKMYFPKRKDAWVTKTRRPVCIFASVLLILVFIIFLFVIVVPALGNAVLVLSKDIPTAFDRFKAWIIMLAAETGFEDVQQFFNTIEIDWNSVYEKITAFLSMGIGSLFNSAFSVANIVVSVTATGLISIIFAIYMLFQKENLVRQLKKAANAYLPKQWAEKGERFLALAHTTFTSFITGQIMEACILGSLCIIGMIILQLPYAMMTGMIVGVSALIPIMGAYIGAFVGAFVIVTVSPAKALVFLIFLVILQQVEGNLIYPKVVGGSIGLPGLWVMAAVTVGGGIMGVPGMLLGVPLTATLYKWVRDDVNERLSRNHVVRAPRVVEDMEQRPGK